MKPEDCVLYSGAAKGAEEAFGTAAERHGIEEVNFTFEGHNDARTRGIRVLTEPELKQGDVNLHYVSRFDAPRISGHAAVSARAPEHLAPGEQRPRGVRGRAYSRRRPPATRRHRRRGPPEKGPAVSSVVRRGAVPPRTGFKSSRGSWQQIDAARTPLVARGYQRTGEEPIDNRSGALRMKSRTRTADRSRHRGFPAGNRPAARWDESAPAGTRRDRTGGAISTHPHRGVNSHDRHHRVKCTLCRVHSRRVTTEGLRKTEQLHFTTARPAPRAPRHRPPPPAPHSE